MDEPKPALPFGPPIPMPGLTQAEAVARMTPEFLARVERWRPDVRAAFWAALDEFASPPPGAR